MTTGVIHLASRNPNEPTYTPQAILRPFDQSHKVVEFLTEKPCPGYHTPKHSPLSLKPDHADRPILCAPCVFGQLTTNRRAALPILRELVRDG